MSNPRSNNRATAVPWALCLAAVVSLCTVGRAEDEPAVPVREAAPEIYYMQDDAGRLVPVPGFRYRDFVDLLRLREGLPGLPEAPAAVLERVTLRGTLSNEPAAAATCRVQVELVVRQARSGWVGLPIGLDGLLLTAAPSHEGPGRMIVSPADVASGPADDPTAGYVLWLFVPAAGAEADASHVVRLEGTIAVEASPTHETLAIDIPRATASLVELVSPRVDPVISVRPAALPPRVEPAPADAGSVVSIVGLSGRTRIRVGDPAAADVDRVAAAAVPQSVVDSVVRIDGRVAVTEARLQLDGLAEGTDTIRVTLPPRSALRGVRAPASLVRMEETEGRSVAVVRVDRSADGRCSCEIQTERPIDPTGREAFDPLGFVVEGIPLWRQWGRTSLVVDGDWQVEWDDLGGFRRIDPADAGRGPGFVAAFAFDVQPARLPLRVRPRGSRLVIEPEYRYDVAAARVSLDARLRVSVRGAPASRIVVQLGDWEVDEVGPSSVVDVAAVSSEGGRLVIPFAQPLSGDAVVEIRGGRRIEPGADRIGWRIPTPQADLVGPASIVIGSQSDIELLPDAAAIQGLVRHVAPSSLRADADRTTLAYRLDGSEGVFAATRRFLPRRVDAIVSVQADIDDDAMLVRETIRLDVAHAPLEFIAFDMAEEVARAGTLEIRQNGQLLNPIEESAGDDRVEVSSPDAVEPVDAPPGDASSGRVRLRAMLAVPLLGLGEVTVQYELPTPTVPAETTVAEELPLALPAAVRIGRQSIALSVPETLAVDVRGTAWKRDVAGPGSAGLAGRTWTTARPQHDVPLAISARQRVQQGEAEVEAAWLQTLLIAGRRRDVRAYAVTSAADRLSLTLPAEPASRGSGEAADVAVEVWLDGRRQPDALRSDGRIVVDLPQREVAGPWLLEIVSDVGRPAAVDGLAAAARMPSVVDLVPPSFASGTVQRRFYWEVLLDPDDHAIRRSGQWTSQQRWEWADVGFQQVAVVPRGALATWLAAAVGDVAIDSPRLRGDPPGVGRRLVYSGIGPPGPTRIWLVPSWLLVAAVSGPVLAIGLVGVYRSWARRGPVILAVTTLASLAAAMAPEVAPLVAQAAVPGAALVALAGGLRAWLGGAEERSRADVAPGAASSIGPTVSRPSLIIAPSLARGEPEATAGVARHMP
jgi:hypothetical protein